MIVGQNHLLFAQVQLPSYFYDIMIYQTTKNQFSTEQNMLAKLAKALAHPARIAILQTLMKQKECICNDFVMQLPLKQATVSQHLKVLKQAGLIKGEIAPNKSCYCINTENWQMVTSVLGGFLEEVADVCQDNCC